MTSRNSTWHVLFAAVTIALVCAWPGRGAADEPAPVSFRAEIAPLLRERCLACHGAQATQGEYRVLSYAELIKPGASAQASVTPGAVDESELLRLVKSTDPDERMPKEGDPLSAEQLALVERWIVEGAKYDADDAQAPLASIIPRSLQPPPPVAYPAPVPILALAFRPDGQELAVGGYREITIWNPATGELLRRLPNLAPRIHDLAYNVEGTLLAVAGGAPARGGEVLLIDPSTGAVVRELASLADEAFCVRFDATGARLAAAAADRSIRIFDTATGAQLHLIEDHADWVLGLAWSPDGSRLVSASRDKTSKVFDTATGDSLVTFAGHAEPVFSAAFSGDGAQVLSAGRDRKIQVWNPADAAKIAEIAGFGDELYELRLVDGQVYSCSADKTARQHAVDSRAEVRNFAGSGAWLYSLAVHPGTRRLATGAFDGEVRIWNLDDGQTVTSFVAAPGFQPGK